MILTAQKTFKIINLLLITAGLYFGISALYTIGSAWLGGTPVESAKSNQPKTVVEPQPEQRPLSAYSAIARRNLFNTNPAAAPTQAETINVEDLKETDLKLKLWGTVAGKERGTYAVIEDTKTREQNLYRTGDTIQNATVKVILRQKVVLSVDGRDEILGMEEIGSGGRRGGPSPRVAERGDTMPPRLPVSSSPRQLTLKSDQIQSALENLDQLMEQARIRPHIEEGQPAGISITGIKPNTVFRRMRLRNGDIITGVNGAPIESVEDAMKIFGDMSSASEVQLEIKRRGRKRTLNYKIE